MKTKKKIKYDGTAIINHVPDSTWLVKYKTLVNEIQGGVDFYPMTDEKDLREIEFNHWRRKSKPMITISKEGLSEIREIVIRDIWGNETEINLSDLKLNNK